MVSGGWWSGVLIDSIAMVVLQARRRSDAVSELCLLSSVELQTIHRFFQIAEKVHAWLNVLTSAFTSHLRHYAKQALKHGK